MTVDTSGGAPSGTVTDPPGGFIQLLTPDGERLQHPDYPLELTANEVRDLYRDLVIVRRVDMESMALQRQGELGVYASLLGQEAAQIGSGRALTDRDMAFPTYREMGVAWTRNVSPVKMLGLFRGVDFGGWDPAEHNFHLYTIVIGSQTLHATGYAMGVQRDGAVGGDNGSAVIAYFGDGATSQGDVSEALGWSAVFNAPIVFFCQNNQWAISEPLTKQTRVPLYHRAQGYGFPGVRVDGNDVFACLAVTRKALQHAREGQGPMFIEAFTYRMGAHTSSDDPTRYRDNQELDAWRAKDPIARVRTYLEKNDLADAAFFDQIDDEAKKIGAAVRAETLALPEPQPSAIFEHVYADRHSLMDEEQAQLTEYLASFEEGE